jgi:hypothetical protein
VTVTVAKLELHINGSKTVQDKFAAQQQLARIVCEMPRRLEDRTMQAMVEACFRKQA